MSGPRQRCCDPHVVFELADGGLTPERAREVHDHLDRCPGCRRLYERELELNESLRSLELGEPRSVCAGVVMALPTRSPKVRFLWATLALALLVAASLALSLYGANPAAFAVDALSVFWSFVSGFADVLRAVLVAAGPVLLVALVAGALVDLLLAAAFLWMTRQRAREA